MINHKILNDENIYQIMDLIPASIYWKDINGCYLGCNQHMLDMFGLTKEQIIGKTDYDILSKEDADKITVIDQSVIINGYFNGEESAIIMGALKTYLSNKIKLCDNADNSIGIFGTSIDISAVKQRMELDKKAALLEEEIKISQILDFVPAHIYWKHKNEYYLGCNKRQREFAGGGDWFGKTEYDFFPKEEADKIHEADQHVLDYGSFSGEEMGTDVNGITKTYFSSKTRLLDSKGEVIGLVGTTVDISDTKEKERLMLENQAHQIAKEQQEKYHKIVNQVVHDIRSPLATMTMILPLCDTLPEDKRNVLNLAAGRISDIANQMLSHFKPDENEPIYEFKPISNLVSTDIFQIIAEKRYEHSQLPIDFITNITQGGHFAFIKIDHRAFKRSLSNLINNAVDACSSSNGMITIYLDAMDDKVQIIIQDNGKGMPETIKTKLLNNVSITSGKSGGHGIGFSQVQDILAASNGKIAIESEIDKGTKITLTFPQIAQPQWICNSIELTSKDLVVILDDDPSIHGAWEARFTQAIPNIQRKHFDQGNDAISFINRLSPVEKSKVFLLTDYELLNQGLHGIDVITKTQIKRSILVTSHYNRPDLQNSAKPSGTKILPKLLASYVPITLSDDTDTQKITEDSSVAMVLVEDDESLADVFKYMLFKDKNVDTYCSPAEFLDKIEKYPKSTKMLIDHEFKGFEMNGIDVLKILHDKGFRNIRLFSGRKFEDLPAYIKLIMKTDIKAVQDFMDTADSKD